MSITISIIIPVYNGEIYLEETLQSLQSQTYSDFEVICVDDSSTDSSLTILNAFAKNDHRIKVFSKPNGGTAAKAIISGLQYASGSYFMYSSQDDLYSSDLLEKNISIARSLKVDAVVPDMVFFWGDNNFKKGIFGINGDRSKVISGREALFLSLDWTIHGFVLWDMDIVRKVGFYDFGLNSDEFTTRALYLNCKKVAFSDGIFYYRQNNVNAITKKWNIKQLDCFYTSNKLEEYLIANDFKYDAILKVHRTILIDLIRLQQMLLRSQKRLTRSDRLIAKNAIKEVYKLNLRKLKELKSKSIKQLLITKVVSSGYIYFNIYTHLHLFYGKIFNENR